MDVKQTVSKINYHKDGGVGVHHSTHIKVWGSCIIKVVHQETLEISAKHAVRSYIETQLSYLHSIVIESTDRRIFCYMYRVRSIIDSINEIVSNLLVRYFYNFPYTAPVWGKYDGYLNILIFIYYIKITLANHVTYAKCFTSLCK